MFPDHTVMPNAVSKLLTEANPCAVGQTAHIRWTMTGASLGSLLFMISSKPLKRLPVHLASVTTPAVIDYNFDFQMSFNSVYRIYRYSCHRLKTPPFLYKSEEFTDFVGECRFCTTVTAGSASYTPVNAIILCRVCVPSSARAVCLCLSSFAAEDSEAALVCASPFVPAEGLAVAYRITAVVIRLCQVPLLPCRHAVIVLTVRSVVVSPRTRSCITLVLPVAVINRTSSSW